MLVYVGVCGLPKSINQKKNIMKVGNQLKAGSIFGHSWDK